LFTNKVFLISILLFFQASSASFAVLVLDQANEPELSLGIGITQVKWEWQEFRPTMNNLEQVDFFIYNYLIPPEEVVFFRITDDSSTTLWSTSFPADIIPKNPQWFVLDTPHIPLIPEKTYRLCLTSTVSKHGPDPSGIIWWGKTGNLYSRGNSSVTRHPGFDFGFRTWAIPEPTTLFLLGLGAVMLRRK